MKVELRSLKKITEKSAKILRFVVSELKPDKVRVSKDGAIEFEWNRKF